MTTSSIHCLHLGPCGPHEPATRVRKQCSCPPPACSPCWARRRLMPTRSMMRRMLIVAALVVTGLRHALGTAPARGANPMATRDVVCMMGAQAAHASKIDDASYYAHRGRGGPHRPAPRGRASACPQCAPMTASDGMLSMLGAQPCHADKIDDEAYAHREPRTNRC